jgi:hypothetical protein
MPTAPEPLADPAAEAIAQRAASLVLAALQSTAPATSPHTDTILTRPEARAYVKRRGEASFCEWCRKWAVRPVSRGRYSRLALDRALDREARAGRRGLRAAA